MAMEEKETGGGSITHTEAQVNVPPMGSANIHSFLLRTFMGRPMILRPDSKLLPPLGMLSTVASIVGREVHVFVSPAAVPLEGEGSSSGPQRDVAEDEPEDFYEFTAADYAQTVKHMKQDTFLKTRKIRDQEEAARMARITKAWIRVQFPDNLILEAVFNSSDPLSLLVELLQKVIQHPELPFYLYTTPPKQRLKDLQQNMYAAGLAPGALVYFSHDALKGQEDGFGGPYLRPEIVALKDLHLLEPAVHGMDTPSIPLDVDPPPETKEPSETKEPKRSGGKPKWFKQR